jgi:hypothetical protein
MSYVDANTVRFGELLTPATWINATSITCVVPESPTFKDVSVTVTENGVDWTNAMVYSYSRMQTRITLTTVSGPVQQFPAL